MDGSSLLHSPLNMSNDTDPRVFAAAASYCLLSFELKMVMKGAGFTTEEQDSPAMQMRVRRLATKLRQGDTTTVPSIFAATGSYCVSLLGRHRFGSSIAKEEEDRKLPPRHASPLAASVAGTVGSLKGPPTVTPLKGPANTVKSKRYREEYFEAGAEKRCKRQSEPDAAECCSQESNDLDEATRRAN